MRKLSDVKELAEKCGISVARAFRLCNTYEKVTALNARIRKIEEERNSILQSTYPITQEVGRSVCGSDLAWLFWSDIFIVRKRIAESKAGC